MAGIRELKKAETRRAIIQSAVQLFTDKGYDKTSIEDIASKAGIGKATVYTYFSNKNEIFQTYCDDELEEAFANLKQPHPEGVSLYEQLIEFFMLKFTYVTENREFGRQLLREMLFPKQEDKKAREHNQRYFDYLDELFSLAQQRGELSGRHDHFYLTAHFYSLYIGALTGWYCGYVSTYEEVESSLRTLFTQVLEGIR